MALTRDKKEALLETFGGILDEATTVVFVYYTNLSAEQANALRVQLKEADVGYQVVKKTLFSRALADRSFAGEQPPLEGELAVAYGDDLIAPARLIHQFGSEHDNVVQISGGIFDGVFKSAEEMQEIATIPDLHTLRGMFVNVINSPIQGLASVLHQVAEARDA